MLCWRAKKWTYAKACYRMESDKEEPCMKIVNTEEFNALMNEDAVLVDFFATWCGPCKMLAPVFEQAGEEMKNDATFLKVDIDQSLELAQQFRISTVPTMMIFKDGKPVETLVGFMPKERIVQKVKSHL